MTCITVDEFAGHLGISKLPKERVRNILEGNAFTTYVEEHVHRGADTFREIVR